MERKNLADYVTIFRRFRRGPDGQQLDAHDYGLKAWPIRIPVETGSKDPPKRTS